MDALGSLYLMGILSIDRNSHYGAGDDGRIAGIYQLC